ncbi:MAG TPA: hypothetical protein VK812_14895 [Candidatus Binatus sp.]|nr:hypothetical protein [Candidatus Binatus sp.]
MVKRLVACLVLWIASERLPAQQDSTATLQENLSTSDSLDATVNSVQGDIKAGEAFKFTVTLDKAPNFAGGGVGFVAVGPIPGAIIGTGCNEDRDAPSRRVYKCILGLPRTAPGGIWSVQRLYFQEGTTSVELKFKPIRFRVIPNNDLVLPTSAEVNVNLDQKQLLRREAGRLQVRIQQLKSTVSEYASTKERGAFTALLVQNLQSAATQLKTTQTEFSRLTTGEGERTNEEVFFDDLHRSYEGVISHLDKSNAALGRTAKLVRVSAKEKSSVESLLALTLRPLEQNELAYKVVADEGSLTFDLEVDSTPEGAKTSYFRKGDPPRPNPDQTRATIPKLPYAIWTVRFEKEGYKTEEREHDPFREPNHVVHIDLQK